jgi:hypothetical protein
VELWAQQKLSILAFSTPIIQGGNFLPLSGKKLPLFCLHPKNPPYLNRAFTVKNPSVTVYLHAK